MIARWSGWRRSCSQREEDRLYIVFPCWTIFATLLQIFGPRFDGPNARAVGEVVGEVKRRSKRARFLLFYDVSGRSIGACPSKANFRRYHPSQPGHFACRDRCRQPIASILPVPRIISVDMSRVSVPKHLPHGEPRPWLSEAWGGRVSLCPDSPPCPRTPGRVVVYNFSPPA